MNFLILRYSQTPRDIKKKKLKKDATQSINVLYKGTEMVLDAFSSGILPLQPTEGAGNRGMLAPVTKVSCNHLSLRILIIKQMV